MYTRQQVQEGSLSPNWTGSYQRCGVNKKNARRLSSYGFGRCGALAGAEHVGKMGCRAACQLFLGMGVQVSGWFGVFVGEPRVPVLLICGLVAPEGLEVVRGEDRLNELVMMVVS